MMRSALLISFAFLLSIQLASSQDDLIGLWKDPITRASSDLYCCVPTSITIDKTASAFGNMEVKYEFPGFGQKGFSAVCSSFFGSSLSGQGKTTLYKDVNTGVYFIQKYDFGGNRNYVFTVNGPTLNVKGPGNSNTCEFTMYTKTSPSSGSPIVLIVLIALIVGVIAYKNHQKKQQAAIIQQNLAQNDTTIYNPNPTYVAPNVHVGFPQQQQQFVQGYPQPQAGFVVQQQPQAGFVVQQQPQMNMNVNMNAGAQDPSRFIPVNGAIAVNVQANQ